MAWIAAFNPKDTVKRAMGSSSPEKIPVTTIILTKDAAHDLHYCLASLSWCNDIHVVDSRSSDGTVSIATKEGAHVLSNPFVSFGQQRNWAIDHCNIAHPWVLFLDADERSTPEFALQLKDAIARADEGVAGFYCCWMTMLGNRWLRRSDNFPKWQFRLFRKGRARFIDVGHGQKEGHVDGRIDYLREPYLHDAFSIGWPLWEEKHRKYAKLEALERTSVKVPSITDLFSCHGSKRNVVIKRLVSKVPGWPYLRFAYSYLIKGGWQEGAEGFEYCKRMMWYESLIQYEVRTGKSFLAKDSRGKG
jgi:glycosyltransferase involved in cell wall biosynthesis